MNEITNPLATEPAKERTPAIIGAEIRMFVDAGRRVTLLCGIEIGRRLCEAKEMLPHGEWLPWLDRETDMTDRTAQRYMRAFNEYGAAQQSFFGPVTNATTLSDLSISKALALLSVPESEREQFAADVDAEHLSARELEKAIRERDQALKEKTELEDRLREAEDGAGLAERKAVKWEETAGSYASQVNDLQADLIEAGKKIKELESRPATVAVERDEKAIEEAAAAARETTVVEYEKKLEEMAKKAEDAEDQLAKAKAAKEKAEEKEKKARAALDGARAEAAKELQDKLDTAEREAREARAALEAAEKRAKLSDADTALFGEYFQTVQRDFARMAELLKKIREQDAERGEKLTAAMRAVLDKCRAELEVQ